jgi:hypothetical protein
MSITNNWVIAFSSFEGDGNTHTSTADITGLDPSKQYRAMISLGQRGDNGTALAVAKVISFTTPDGANHPISNPDLFFGFTSNVVAFGFSLDTSRCFARALGMAWEFS